jgi:hypothetical protein
MKGRLLASGAILEDRNAVLRDFQEPNRSGYASILEVSGDGFSDFVEPSRPECDDAGPCV